jgi:hypothetical protein
VERIVFFRKESVHQARSEEIECVSVCLFVCVFVCLSVCLPVCLSVCLPVCLLIQLKYRLY